MLEKECANGARLRHVAEGVALGAVRQEGT